MSTAQTVPLVDLQGLTFQRAGSGPRRSGTGQQTAAADDAFSLQVPRFRLARSEALVIGGPSGSGKSTFLDLLALLRRPTSSSVFRLAGRDAGALWQMSARAARTRLRAGMIGYVLQTGGLLPYLDVEENLRLPQRLLGHGDPRWVTHLLEVLGLSALRHRLPAALSIGERQRVAVARAVAHRPALVLADEPTASLDPAHGERVLALLVSLCREAGAGLVVVSHDAAIADRHRLEPVGCRRVAGHSVIER